MSRISIKDIPRDYRIGREELRRIRGGGSLSYMTLHLGNVTVSGYSPSTGSTGDPLPAEELSFDYDNVNWTYDSSSSGSSSDWNTPND